MIQINIDNQTYKLPKRLSIEDWQKIARLDIQDHTLWPKIVATAYNAPIHKLIDAPRETLELGLRFILELLQRQTECKKKDLNQMTFGEFIDLDIWLVDGHDKWLHKISNLAGDTKWADEALWLCHEAASWRVWIYKQYKELFGLDEANEFSEMFEQEVPSSVEQARSWMQVLYALSNDNVLNINPITELPLRQALNFMAMRKQKVQKQIEEQNQQKRKLNLVK